MPLPPNSSRAHATVSRHLAVVNALESAAWASVSLQLSHANHHALRSGDVREHFGQKVLHELKRADRLSELQSLLAIFERVLVRAHPASCRLPRHKITRHFQHPRGVAERAVALKTVLL